jgi:ABC-type lipoprotein release transport system permease subunit
MRLELILMGLAGYVIGAVCGVAVTLHLERRREANKTVHDSGWRRARRKFWNWTDWR